MNQILGFHSVFQCFVEICVCLGFLTCFLVLFTYHFHHILCHMFSLPSWKSSIAPPMPTPPPPKRKKNNQGAFNQGLTLMSPQKMELVLGTVVTYHEGILPIYLPLGFLTFCMATELCSMACFSRRRTLGNVHLLCFHENSLYRFLPAQKKTSKQTAH